MCVRSLALAPVLATVLAVVPAPAGASELIGGYAISYATGYPYDPTMEDSEYTTSTNVVSASAGSTGYSTAAKSATTPWVNKIETTSDMSAVTPSSTGISYAAALSLYAVNMTVTGPGTTANLSFDFSVDGSFTPGPNNVFAPTETKQNLAIYLVAYYGTAESIYLDNGIFYLKSNHGLTTLNVRKEEDEYRDDGADFLIPDAAKAACPAPTFTCLGATSFDDYLMHIDLNIAVGDPFVIIAYVGAYTNGTTDFFNTVKLKSIGLDPAYTLNADDNGALARNADGSYSLAINAVPEPGTWAMMLVGFGAIGFGMRRRREHSVTARYA